MLLLSILAVSYNQPRFTRGTSWNPYAVTILNSTSLPNNPTRIFINTNNTWFVAADVYGQIFSGIEGSMNLTVVGQGSHGLFVTADSCVYSYDGGSNQVNLWSTNGTRSHPVMFINSYCRGLFVDGNNTLYCSLSAISQIVSKSLFDSTNTLRVVAGTGCYGSSSDMLFSPQGIFVDLNFSLYVADSENHRIQRFTAGQINAITVAGNGTSGTITLRSPRDVTLDGAGYLFIVDTDNHRIIASGPDGFRCVAGCMNSSGAASNQLSHPQSMSFDSNGNMWVADYDNRRVQKFILRNHSTGKHDLIVPHHSAVFPTLIESKNAESRDATRHAVCS